MKKNNNGKKNEGKKATMVVKTKPHINGHVKPITPGKVMDKMMSIAHKIPGETRAGAKGVLDIHTSAIQAGGLVIHGLAKIEAMFPKAELPVAEPVVKQYRTAEELMVMASKAYAAKK